MRLQLLLLIVVGFYSAVLMAFTKEGAILEYPIGRYQENQPPQFFKWTLINPSQSLTLKIYKTNEDGSYDDKNDLIARFDFLSDTKSMNWSGPDFTRGKYLWTLEIFDHKKTEPISISQTRFIVEALKNIDLRAQKFGLIAGFSRGQFSSEDSDYNLEFNTTPTNYGLFYRGGQSERLFDVSFLISDFTLQGEVFHVATLSSSYSWQISGKSPYDFEIFLGAIIRAQSFTRVRSENGEDLTKKAVTVLNPGFLMTLQKQMDPRIALYSHFYIDTPVVGTEEVEIGFNQISLNYHGGMLYNLSWPLGFGGELRYKLDKMALKESDDDVAVAIQEFSVLAYLAYAF